MTEVARLDRNDQRLAECHPVMAGRFAAIIVDLEGRGWRPRIQEAARSAADQAMAVLSGHSQVAWSFHMAQSMAGVPEALAVDLLDDDKPLRPTRLYLMTLAVVAGEHACRTGILWGLADGPRGCLQDAITRGDIRWLGALGQDPTHVEPADLPLALARAGARPA